MSVFVRCDGCGEVLPSDGRAIGGERKTAPRDGILPSDRFDWCVRCAHVAFTAVRDANRGRT